MEETAKSRLLLILKYGDICFAPGFKTDKGYKLIVSDPEDQVKIDNVNYFYHMICLILYKKICTCLLAVKSEL